MKAKVSEEGIPPQDCNIETLLGIPTCCPEKSDSRWKEQLRSNIKPVRMSYTIWLCQLPWSWTNSWNTFLSLFLSLALYPFFFFFQAERERDLYWLCFSRELKLIYVLHSQLTVIAKTSHFQFQRLACVELVILFLYTILVIINTAFHNQ